MRVAVVHDWLYVLGGAEKVLTAILRCFPGADLYTLFDNLAPNERQSAGIPKSKTTFLQRMPSIQTRHRAYLPLMPLAVEQLDMTGYDLIISSSHAVAKGVITGADQLHISYVHSPMRYAWDMQHVCLREAGLDHGLKGYVARYILFKMRMWDTRTAAGVDAYIANSHFVGRRIRKVYGRDSTVIHPPVNVPKLAPPPSVVDARTDAGFYLAASRLVPYKNMLAIVEAFKALPAKRLIVAGDGPELDRLKAVGAANVEFAGFVPDAELRRLMRSAKAFVFAAEEDFGILPVEVQAEGTPVIALGRGGARETVIVEGPSPTGLFFDRPEPARIIAAIDEFDRRAPSFTRVACHANAIRFSADRFEADFSKFVHAQYDAFRTRLTAGLAGVDPDRRTQPAWLPATVATSREHLTIGETAANTEHDAFAGALSRETA